MRIRCQIVDDHLQVTEPYPSVLDASTGMAESTDDGTVLEI